MSFLDRAKAKLSDPATQAKIQQGVTKVREKAQDPATQAKVKQAAQKAVQNRRSQSHGPRYHHGGPVVGTPFYADGDINNDGIADAYQDGDIDNDGIADVYETNAYPVDDGNGDLNGLSTGDEYIDDDAGDYDYDDGDYDDGGGDDWGGDE